MSTNKDNQPLEWKCHCGVPISMTNHPIQECPDIIFVPSKKDSQPANDGKKCPYRNPDCPIDYPQPSKKDHGEDTDGAPYHEMIGQSYGEKFDQVWFDSRSEKTPHGILMKRYVSDLLLATDQKARSEERERAVRLLRAQINFLECPQDLLKFEQILLKNNTP